MKHQLATLGILGTLTLVTSTTSANLIVNGGFETGDFSGWTLSADPLNTAVVEFSPRTGDYAAFLGEIGTIGHLTQSFPTTPGTVYTLSVFLATDGDPNSFFGASVDGSPLINLVNPESDLEYVEYTASFAAAGVTSLLDLSFRDDAFFIVMDDVSVVPEPTSFAMIGLGSAAMFRRRRAR